MKVESTLRKSLTQYFELQNTERMGLNAVIGKIAKHLPETVIFGGMLREFSLGNAKSFTSDIDLVSASKSEEIEKVISIYEPIRNKFGGFRFTVNRRRFDIWSLRDTWAFRQNLVGLEGFSSLLNTSFFNLDAAYFQLDSCQVKVHENYETWQKSRLLDINLEENPHPQQMVRRALDLIIRNQLLVGSHLLQYVIRNVDRTKLVWEQELLLDDMVAFANSGSSEPFKFKPQSVLVAH